MSTASKIHKPDFVYLDQNIVKDYYVQGELYKIGSNSIPAYVYANYFVYDETETTIRTICVPTPSIVLYVKPRSKMKYDAICLFKKTLIIVPFIHLSKFKESL